MALARCSRSSFWSLRSTYAGGKNTADWGPRQAAFTCHASAARWLDTEPLSLAAGKIPPPGAPDKGRFAWSGSRVSPRRAVGLDRFDLEHKSLHAGHAYRLSHRNRSCPTCPGSPQRLTHAHHALGVESGRGLADLADDGPP